MKTRTTLKTFSSLSFDAGQVTEGAVAGIPDSQPQLTPDSVRGFTARHDRSDEITEANPFLSVIAVTRHPEVRSLAEAAGTLALVEKPVDVPALVQTMQELLAEPVQSRMRHTCPEDVDFRHVPASGEGFREVLQRRFTPPYRSAPPYHRGGINE